MVRDFLRIPATDSGKENSRRHATVYKSYYINKNYIGGKLERRNTMYSTAKIQIKLEHETENTDKREIGWEPEKKDEDARNSKINSKKGKWFRQKVYVDNNKYRAASKV